MDVSRDEPFHWSWVVLNAPCKSARGRMSFCWSLVLTRPVYDDGSSSLQRSIAAHFRTREQGLAAQRRVYQAGKSAAAQRDVLENASDAVPAPPSMAPTPPDWTCERPSSDGVIGLYHGPNGQQEASLLGAWRTHTGSYPSATVAMVAANRAFITPPHLSLGSAVQVGSYLGTAQEVRLSGEGVEVRVTFDGGVEEWKRAVEVELVAATSSAAAASPGAAPSLGGSSSAIEPVVRRLREGSRVSVWWPGDRKAYVGKAVGIRFNGAALVGGVEIDVLYDDSDREWEPDAAVVLLSAPAVPSDGGGDSAPSSSADASGTLPGGHTLVECASFMKPGVSGVQCTVLSHFKCDHCGEPEIVYCTGLGVHFMGVSQRTVREETLSTGEVRIVTQHARGTQGTRRRGWVWLDRQVIVASFSDFRFSSSSPHWVLDLSPVRDICELPNAIERVTRTFEYVLPGGLAPRSMYDEARTYSDYLGQWMVKALMCAILKRWRLGAYDQEDMKMPQPHISGLCVGYVAPSLNGALAESLQNEMGYQQLMGQAFDVPALKKAIGMLDAVVVHGGRDLATLRKEGIVDGRGRCWCSLKILRYYSHQNQAGKQPDWQSDFSWSTSVVVPLWLQREYRHGERDAEDQLEFTQLFGPAMLEGYQASGDLDRLREELKRNGGVLLSPLSKEAWEEQKSKARKTTGGASATTSALSASPMPMPSLAPTPSTSSSSPPSSSASTSASVGSKRLLQPDTRAAKRPRGSGEGMATTPEPPPPASQPAASFGPSDRERLAVLEVVLRGEARPGAPMPRLEAREKPRYTAPGASEPVEAPSIADRIAIVEEEAREQEWILST